MAKRGKRALAGVLLGLACLFTFYAGDVEGDSPGETGAKIGNIRLFYASKAINEVPFFLSKSVALESGDNKDDFLVFIPSQSYQVEPVFFKDQPRLRQMENPRPDASGALKIVFSAIGANGRKGIYVIDGYDPYSFAALKAQPLFTDEHNNWHPSLNSKRNLLAFVSDAPGSPQIFLFDLKTGKPRRLTDLARAESPCLDARGEWIYFTGIDGNGNYDIYKIKTDGEALTRLTSSPEIEKYPTLTKYGDWIVYERGTRSKRSIWLMRPDGTAQREISDPKYWASGPCMNAEGTMVLFEGKIDGRTGIYLADVPEAVFRDAGTLPDFTPGMDVARNVINLRQFGDFTEEQLRKLSEYGFFVVPTQKQQLFYIYEENEYNKIPNFVTADNLLQLLHLIFNTSLKNTEEKTLLAKLTAMEAGIRAELAKRTALAKDPAYVSLRRYFAVLHYLLYNESLPKDLNAEDKKVVLEEIQNIKAQKKTASPIFQTLVDYSFFKIRGHYETSAALKKYFLAMNWLSQMPFRAKTEVDRRRILLAAELLTANKEIAKNFTDIYRITRFYAGDSDDPDFYDFGEIWQKETGKPPLYADYNEQKIQTVLAGLFSEHQAKIETFYAETERNEPAIYLMGPRYVADSHLFSLLFKEVGVRYLPRGLDLFAALGDETAYDILKDETPLLRDYPAYPQVLAEAHGLMATLGESPGEPLFNRWLRLLKIYVTKKEEAAPALFRTEHWQRKKLNTALASWAELKHDTILYGKQTGAECGGGDEPPKVYGYIEPALELYKSMRAMLSAMEGELAALGAEVHDLQEILALVDFFILVSEKELQGAPLTDQENEQLRIIGGLLEAATIEALGEPGLRWFEITSESAKNMAVVADILYFWGAYLEEGVGYADEIYAVVPVQGQLYLMRGSVFSYYEFLNNERLSDSEWYERLKSMTVKERATWWQRYLEREKGAIPAPADPYDSGC